MRYRTSIVSNFITCRAQSLFIVAYCPNYPLQTFLNISVVLNRKVRCNIPLLSKHVAGGQECSVVGSIPRRPSRSRATVASKCFCKVKIGTRVDSIKINSATRCQSKPASSGVPLRSLPPRLADHPELGIAHVGDRRRPRMML